MRWNPGPDPRDEARAARWREPVRLAWVHRSRRWSDADLEAFHERQLGAVLEQARLARLWADRLPARLGPDRVTMEQFRTLDIVDKSVLLDAGSDARARPQRGAVRVPLWSSGSTGQHLALEWSQTSAQWLGTHARAASLARGIPLRRSSMWFRANARSSVGAGGPAVNRSPQELADEVADTRPQLIGGLPHLLVEVGECLRGRHRPRWVVVGGETTDPAMRADLRRHFGCEPFDTYASIEVGNIAWQCRERDLYHLNHTFVLTEVVDAAGVPVGPGGTGDVVVTGLAHPATPLIRYRQGDRATLADRACRCGSELPALARLDGRVHDWFLVPGGRVAPQRLYLSRHLDEPARIARYRLQQDGSGAVVLTYVTRDGRPLPEPVAERVRSSYEATLPGVPVSLQAVDEIPASPSGKLEQLRSWAVEPMDRRRQAPGAGAVGSGR